MLLCFLVDRMIGSQAGLEFKRKQWCEYSIAGCARQLVIERRVRPLHM